MNQLANGTESILISSDEELFALQNYGEFFYCTFVYELLRDLKKFVEILKFRRLYFFLIRELKKKILHSSVEHFNPLPVIPV